MENYDVVSDVDGRFSKEFRNYAREANLVCLRWRPFYKSTTLFWVFEKENGLHGIISAYRRFTDKMMLLSNIDLLQNSLVQFWKAEEVVNSDVDDFGERRFLLTTSNEPFIIWDHPWKYNREFCEGICSYRMRTPDVITTRIGRGGAISRVFQNNRMECTPHVSYYSSEEYPHRDMAVSCQIESSLIVPLSDSSGCSVGVVELVSQSNWPNHFVDRFISCLPGRDCCKGLCGQYDLEKDSLNKAVSEIRDVIEVVWESCDLELIQTWILCNVCNSLSTIDKCGDGLHASKADWFGKKSSFLEIESYHILRKGEGIVGKAATSSHNMVYCEDVAKYNITEYPLAHFARKHNLAACFAICLQSKHSGDQVYVLEFFLSSINGEVWDLRNTLVLILNKMRQNFKTFKVAYGREEIGDSLSVLVTDASSPDKVETICLPLVVVPSAPQKILPTRLPGILRLTGANNVNDSNREGRRRGKSTRSHFLQQSIGESFTSEAKDDSMIRVETSFEHIPIASASTVQSEHRVTIKANYGGDSVRFRLSTSSGIHELNHQVSQRLQLVVGTYDLKYPDDDNDLIELTCDDDLQLYISSSGIHENSTLVVLIVPR